MSSSIDGIDGIDSINPIEPVVIRTLRRILLIIIAASLAGTAAELLLLGHTETAIQWIPLVCFALAAIALVAVVTRASAVAIRAFQIVMFGCVLAGVAGLFFHMKGNIEFASETYPAMKGRALLWEAATGATPLLAPGAMIQMGLVGLAFTYRHPALTRRGYMTIKP